MPNRTRALEEIFDAAQNKLPLLGDGPAAEAYRQSLINELMVLGADGERHATNTVDYFAAKGPAKKPKKKAEAKKKAEQKKKKAAKKK